MDTPETRNPTMIDVARLAGVSHQTVSRFVAGDETIREVNKRKIESAIAALDYRPNIVARSMRTRRSGLITIIVPATVNPYGPERATSAVIYEAHAAGYEVEVVHVDGGAAGRTARALELADSQLVEAVLSLGSLELEDRHRAGRVPIVQLVVFDDQLNGAGPLLDASPIAEIVEHLASLGHRDFFHVGGPVGHPASDSRQGAYEQEIARRGLVSHGIHRGGSWDGAIGVEGVHGLPDDTAVTAVVCANDGLAAGAIRAAYERGWAVPGRISVTGWDNRSVGRFMPPGLSTVAVDRGLLGRQAFARLLAVLKGAPVPEPDFTGLNTVIWRGSVAPPPAVPGR